MIPDFQTFFISVRLLFHWETEQFVQENNAAVASLEGLRIVFNGDIQFLLLQLCRGRREEGQSVIMTNAVCFVDELFGVLVSGLVRVINEQQVYNVCWFAGFRWVRDWVANGQRFNAGYLNALRIHFDSVEIYLTNWSVHSSLFLQHFTCTDISAKESLYNWNLFEMEFNNRFLLKILELVSDNFSQYFQYLPLHLLSRYFSQLTLILVVYSFQLLTRLGLISLN